MRKIFKELLILALALSMMSGLLAGSKTLEASAAEQVDITQDDGMVDTDIDTMGYGSPDDNMHGDENWASPIGAYLEAVDTGFMAVQYSEIKRKLIVTYYDDRFHINGRKDLDLDLPIWGGFYSTKDAYYIVTGRGNGQESADVEVFRLTKYDKDWNRIQSVGWRDYNTYIPFKAGSCHMAVWGDYLIIHTSHQMYQSSDGLRHQSNCDLIANMNTMEAVTELKDFRTGKGDISGSTFYVGHSFNQHIQTDGDAIVFLDQGDAYPRSLCLTRKRLTDSEELKSNERRATYNRLEILPFVGETGDNYTGASSGGFEVCGNSYIVCGNSVVQDEKVKERKTRNVFVSFVDKDMENANLMWLTDYAEGEETASTPCMVKLDEHRCMVLWNRTDEVYYAVVNDNGQIEGEICHHEGYLSDCLPILHNGKIVWYTVDGITMDFYQIPVSNLDGFQCIETARGHLYQKVKNLSYSKGLRKVLLRCQICGHEEALTVRGKINYNTYSGLASTYLYPNKDVYDKHNEVNVYAKKLKVGQKIDALRENEIMFYRYTSKAYLKANNELGFDCSDYSIFKRQRASGILFDDYYDYYDYYKVTDYQLYPVKEGISLVRFFSKWCPDESNSHTYVFFIVGNPSLEERLSKSLPHVSPYFYATKRKDMSTELYVGMELLYVMKTVVGKKLSYQYQIQFKDKKQGKWKTRNIGKMDGTVWKYKYVNNRLVKYADNESYMLKDKNVKYIRTRAYVKQGGHTYYSKWSDVGEWKSGKMDINSSISM